MSEYYDIKHKAYKIIESVPEHNDRSAAEEEIVAELFKIFGKK